jgi:hypothetical protein
MSGCLLRYCLLYYTEYKAAVEASAQKSAEGYVADISGKGRKFNALLYPVTLATQGDVLFVLFRNPVLPCFLRM